MMLTVSHAQGDSLEKLADDFWTWRAKYGPFTGDDVNRMERPGGTRDWSGRLIEALDLPRRVFPRIVPSGTVLGPLRPELARH